MNKQQAVYYAAKLEAMEKTIGTIRFRAGTEGLADKAQETKDAVQDLREHLEGIARAGGSR